MRRTLSIVLLTVLAAEAILKEFFAIQTEKQKTQAKYVDRFERVLRATAVARFYQIENKLDAIVSYDLASEVPLAQSPGAGNSRPE